MTDEPVIIEGLEAIEKAKLDVAKFGTDLMAGIAARLGAERIDLLSDEHKRWVTTVIEDMTTLTVRAAAGEDVGVELKIVGATMKNWKFTGAGAIRRALGEAAAHAANLAGGIAAGFVGALLGLGGAVRAPKRPR